MNFSLARRSLIGFGLAAFATSQSQALDFGIYDARALAMGGTAVAAASGQNAQFYNPALLASYAEEEEDSRNGRVYLPAMVVQFSQSIQDTADIAEDDLDETLEASVDALNDIGTDGDLAQYRLQAGNVSTAASDVIDAIEEIGNRDLSADAFFGMSVSEPANREGGAFYFGFRAVGGGTSSIPQEDLDLLRAYIDELDFVAAGGAPRVTNTELYDGTQLRDPTDVLVSSASVASLAMAEWGVSASREFEFFGQPIAFGVTPKIMYVEVFVDNLLFTGTDIDYSEDSEEHVEVNADVGAFLPIGNSFRFGVAGKDVIPMKLKAANGLSVETEARWRAGLAYQNSWVTVGLDYDLVENEPLATESSVQDLSLGAEFRINRKIQIRAGYREDQAGNRGAVTSGGVGLHFRRFVADFAYATGDELEGGALQLGWTF